MELSICIIVKNDEVALEKCLKSLAPYEVEIVIVDTGSTDKTKKTAKRYTDSVYDFKWCDDFSKAKNYAVHLAKNEMVLVLDSDEWIESLDEKELCKLMQKNQGQIGRIQRVNLLEKDGIPQDNKEWIHRIFSKEHFMYEGKIHEQVISKRKQEYLTYQAPITIMHTGYLGTKEKLEAKAKRNLTLLLLELKEEEEDPYILYQLGKSYYMISEYQKACEYFAEGLEFDVNPELEYVNDMVETYGYSLINSKQYEEALLFENIYDQFGDTADFQFLMGLIYMNNEMFEKAIEEFEKATRCIHSRVIGVNAYLAWYNIGVILECLGYKEKAIVYYEKCGSYEKSLERLAFLSEELRILNKNPESLL